MMKTLMFLAAFFAVFSPGIAACGEAGQTVQAAGAKPSSYANGKNFTGVVRVDPAFQSREPARAYGAYVTFEPGSRTNWHIHPLGQTLIVTAGKGLVQEWGKTPVVIRPGDIVCCPPGVKHWHGASPETGMTHLAIGERAGGMGAQWLEKFEDGQYQEAARTAGEARK